ncbi:MAG: DUF1569 domain-containing protein [Ignavibacteria bacterium]
MESIFDISANKKLIDRVNKLSPKSKPEWGKMKVSQMLVHCKIPIQSAFGDIKIKREFAGILFGRIAKKMLSGDKPFKKNLPTNKAFQISNDPDLKEEKQKLLKLIRRFIEAGPNGITKQPHPFFGNLTTQEWDNMMWKHLDHHLRQFGV